MTIKAIETRYAGCRFRSRLEARWAVFFDRLGITWEYEPEGLVLDTGECYLPDFRLPGPDNLLVEVKGSDDMLDPGRLAAATTDGYLLILGPIPRPGPPTPLHWMIRRIGGQPHLTMMFFATARSGGYTLVQVGPEYFYAPEAIGDIAGGRVCDRLTTDPLVNAAYEAARSARFEHGESG